MHLLSAANPVGPDIGRFGFDGVDEYVDFIREHLPRPLRLTFSRPLLRAVEEPARGGRRDDAGRVRDLQTALSDPRTVAIVASNGGGWFSRILPQIDFSVLATRRTPLTVLGFSELTGLVNAVAGYRAGRGVYWLCPNYLAWKVSPPSAARAAFGRFWSELLGRIGLPGFNRLPDEPIRGALRSGRLREGRIRLVGGCLSVMAALLAGPIGRRVRPDGRWLLIEDVNEAAYRIDRHLATFKHAGWFDRLGGILVGDFHHRDEGDQAGAVLELLRYHVPRGRAMPIVTTSELGHVWPMIPALLNRPLTVRAPGSQVSIST